MCKRCSAIVFLAFLVTTLSAQVVLLPDSLFNTSFHDEYSDVTGVDKTSIVKDDLSQPLFVVEPALTFKDYIEAPANPTSSFFVDLPDVPSEFWLHVILLHLSREDIPGLAEKLANYNLMLENFNRNLYSGGGYSIPYVAAPYSDVSRMGMMSTTAGSGVVITGCLDPLEAYRRWVQKKRMERAKQVISDFENDLQPVNNENSAIKLVLPQNLLQENNYDVKIKKDGDNPPFRP